jgi:hypothetical protein
MADVESSSTESEIFTNSPPVITAFRTFELRPMPIKQESWFPSSRDSTTESKRVFRVFEINDDGSLGLGRDVLRYYIDTSAEYHFPIWPFNGSQAVSIFAVDMPPEDILNRKAVPLEIMQQTHPLGGRFMCTVGGIGESNETSTEVEKSDSEPVQKCRAYSGLGHGEWSDEPLAKMLGITPKSPNSGTRTQLHWNAMGSEWYHVRSGWPGKGKVNGGGLVLTANNQVLAIYKPRSSQWAEVKEGEDGNGVGVLAICSEKIDHNMARHILVSAVTIEEQIMWSKGFHPDKYHGGWM